MRVNISTGNRLWDGETTGLLFYAPAVRWHARSTTCFWTAVYTLPKVGVQVVLSTHGRRRNAERAENTTV